MLLKNSLAWSIFGTCYLLQASIMNQYYIIKVLLSLIYGRIVAPAIQF